jgi:hypothetical protein
MKPTQSGWTASELADQTAKQLPAYCNKPTERLVRYYTSEGILDKPARTDADKRRAIYGQRQILQLSLAMIFNYAGPGAVAAHKRGYLRMDNDHLANMLHEATNPGGIAYQANALKVKVLNVASKKGGSK